MKFGYRDKVDRAEIPYSPGDAPGFHDPSRRMYRQHHVPDNDYQALMETIPGADVPMTAQEREADWLLFQEKLEAAGLTERERIVVDCVVMGGMSLSQTAIVVAQAEGLNKAPAKMVVARCRDRALEKIRNVFTSWEDQ